MGRHNPFAKGFTVATTTFGVAQQNSSVAPPFINASHINKSLYPSFAVPVWMQDIDQGLTLSESGPLDS